MDAAWKAGIVEEDGAVYLELEVDEAVLAAKAVLLGTEDLGCTRAVEGLFENPDGTPITFETDYCGTKRYADAVKVGPLAGLKAGYNKIRVW